MTMMTCSRPVDRKKGFPYDLRKTEEGFEITAALPGVALEDIKIRVDNEELLIQAERKDAENRDGYSRSEIYRGMMERLFALPSSVDTGKVDASFENGILTVTLPLKPETRPRAVNINTGK